MSLTYAKMSEDVWLTCLTHALSTETEEIMGLLLGDIVYSKDGSIVALIWGASPQSRSDRRKDRVETTPEQLAAASAQAERMTISTGRTTRVIGWYHSHPHITVLPSHVDVRTQAMYQLLDSGFIGLIFSCFSEDVNKVGRIQVIAFQSSDGNRNSTNNSLTVFRKSNDQVIDIESSRSSSESMSYGKSYSAMAEHPEQDTGDSRGSSGSKGGGRAMDFGAYFVNNTANTTGRDGNSDTNNLNNAIVEIDPIDMSEGMQEAMLRSNMDVSGAEYVRKEIPLHVLPASSLFQLDYPLSSYTDLQHVLFDEERAAYQQAVLQTMRDGRVHPLLFIHHTSTYQASMCKLIEHCLSPAISALQDRLRENEIRLERLKDEAKTLEVEALSRSDSRGESPRHVSGSGSRSKRGF